MTDQPTGESVELVERPQGVARLDAGLAVGNSVLAPADWQMLSAIAETVNKTEFVPRDLRGNAPKVLACMLYGHAIGVQPMIALKEIAVIDGTPSMSAALMVAKVLERGHSLRREELWEDDENAVGGRVMVGVTAHGKRADTGAEDSFTFTINMARRAGLMGKKNWQNYPEAMLWHRASSQLCTFLFPDVFMGSPYMPEELGADLMVDATSGHVVEPVAREEEGIAGFVAAHETASPNLGGAVSPAVVEEEPVEPVAEPTPETSEAVVEPPAEAETEVEVVEVEVVAEEDDEAPFWTPLDEREPTEAEYEFAKAVIANTSDLVYTSDEDRADAVAGAQVLVEAYELVHPPTVAKPGTIAVLMTEIADAKERNDANWLRELRGTEGQNSKPRVRLIAAIDEALEAMGETAESQPKVEGDGGRFDPTLPLPDLEKDQLIMRTRAVIAYMTDQAPENTAWHYAGIITAAGVTWKLPVESLDDLEGWHLRAILQAAPADAMKVIDTMTGEQIEKLAATAPGENPA